MIYVKKSDLDSLIEKWKEKIEEEKINQKFYWSEGYETRAGLAEMCKLDYSIIVNQLEKLIREKAVKF